MIQQKSVDENLQLMKTPDDAWNTQDWDMFNKRHAENVAVYWPGASRSQRGDGRRTRRKL